LFSSCFKNALPATDSPATINWRRQCNVTCCMLKTIFSQGIWKLVQQWNTRVEKKREYVTKNYALVSYCFYFLNCNNYIAHTFSLTFTIKKQKWNTETSTLL
jgi:hypothetical protein